MADNVTYIIGAGASAEAIPVVGEKFNEHFCRFCDILSSRSRTYGNLHQSLRPFLDRVILELPNHYSVDTYARKFCFTNKNEYAAFKFLMSYYFLFEQLADSGNLPGEGTAAFENTLKTFPKKKKKIDPRYDVVYAALLDEKNKSLPENMKFISWNYDCQFELSYKGFLNCSIEESFKKLKVYPSIHGRQESDSSKANFLKLNGTAGLYFEQSSELLLSGFKFFQSDNANVTTNIVDGCLQFLDLQFSGKNENHRESLLHFAWEDLTEVKVARKRAKEIIKETDILVVIGYSFPLYNRKVDRDIFSALQTDEIYIQVPESNFNEVQERFTTVANFNIPCKHIGDLKQFYIPDSLI